MDEIKSLIEQNRSWAKECEDQDPGSFARLANSQSPEYLWIGCIDSRMPAEQMTGMKPGDMLVYRNIANQVNPADKSCMAAIQFAVDVLKVKHIIVTGHTNCGGVTTALKGGASAPLGDWLTPISELGELHRDQLDSIACERDKVTRLCELSIEQQVLNVAENPTRTESLAAGPEALYSRLCL